MKRFLGTLVLGGALAVSLLMSSGAPAHAQTSYPRVSSLQPFSADSNYMSLAGYLRFLVYQRDGVWMDRTEAASIVNQQIATGE